MNTGNIQPLGDVMRDMQVYPKYSRYLCWGYN